MKISTKQLATAGVIAALYAALTLSLSFLSYANVQYRVAEALTILPLFSPVYIGALYVGCIIANLGSTLGPVDIVIGSFASLLAAVATYYIGKSNLKYKKFIAPIPPVLFNAVIVGLELHYLIQLPLFLTMLQVGWGEFVCAYILGVLLLHYIEKKPGLKKLLSER